jgi:hypothetical protein
MLILPAVDMAEDIWGAEMKKYEAVGLAGAWVFLIGLFLSGWVALIGIGMVIAALGFGAATDGGNDG